MKNVMGNSPEIKNNSKYLELSKYFYGFSHPLVTLALFSTMAIFFDRWLLIRNFSAFKRNFLFI